MKRILIFVVTIIILGILFYVALNTPSKVEITDFLDESKENMTQLPPELYPSDGFKD